MLVLDYTVNGKPKTVGVHIEYDRFMDAPTDTRVFITDEINEKDIEQIRMRAACGVAYLHSNDQFNRKAGRRLAFERAVRVFTPDVKERAALWGAFLNRVRIR